MEQGLGQLFIASSGSYFFNLTDLEQYLFNVRVILKITFTQILLRRILSFFFVAPLVACALIVWLAIVLSMIFAKSPEVMCHFHTDQILTREQWRFVQFSFSNPSSRMFLISWKFFSVVIVSYCEFALL